jgi:hypothetical protein
MKKYELVKTDAIEVRDKTLYRIRALQSFATIAAGELGGYIQGEANLSHEGNAWVFDDALVYGKAHLSGNVQIFDTVRVYGKAALSGNLRIFGEAEVFV